MTTLAKRALDAVSFGEAIVDFFPDQVGKALSEIERFHRHLGGAPTNVAVGLSRLGARAALMTLVGNDEFGRFIRQQLEREGVDTRGVGTHRTARTGITFVSIGERGERSFQFYRERCADMMVAPVDVDADLIGDARIFHFGSSTLAREPSRAATLAALADAREAGCVVSCDPNFRPHVWDHPAQAQGLIRQTLADCDVVKMSDDEVAPLLGVIAPEAAARALRDLGVKLAVITLGARGCYFDAPGGAGYLPGEKVDVIDTTGAGDGFWAALLVGVAAALRAGRSIEDLPRPELERALAFANRVGARTVTRIGAAEAIPALAEVA